MRLVVSDHTAVLVPARTDFAHEDQLGRIRMQRLAYELIDDVGAVELRGIDVVDPALPRDAEHADGLSAIPRWAEHVRAR